MDEAPGLFTIGYEDLRIDQFVNKLRENHINTVVDVRLTASSRRPGFSKTALTSALAAAGVGYVHERDLGNPPSNRDAFRKGRVEEGRVLMKARLENGSADALRRLIDRAGHERVAVLCVEAFDATCHRQIIVEMAREIEPGLKTISIW
ncbi:MAG: DUF488 domain-containing protein [Acidimicrobiales bacterium]